MSKFAENNGQESNYSYDHKKVLKIFFRWLKLGSRELNEVGDPEETKKVNLGKIRDKIVREDLITDEDRKRLLVSCSGNLRDRALIDVQCEAGTRPGELLTLKIKHVKFDEYGAIIHVDGKTGARPVRLIRSTPNLSSWIDAHQFKDNPNAPLWINMSKKYFGTQLSAASARQIIQRVCKKANMSKRVYLNLFRHSEATNSARKNISSTTTSTKINFFWSITPLVSYQPVTSLLLIILVGVTSTNNDPSTALRFP